MLWTFGLLKKPEFTKDTVSLLLQDPCYATLEKICNVNHKHNLILSCAKTDSRSLQAKGILPLAGVHTLGNLLTNVSLGRVAVSFTHTIKVKDYISLCRQQLLQNTAAVTHVATVMNMLLL